MELTEENGALNGKAKIDANVTFAPGPCTTTPSDTFGIGNLTVSGSANSIAFTDAFSNSGTGPGRGQHLRICVCGLAQRRSGRRHSESEPNDHQSSRSEHAVGHRIGDLQ